MKYLITKSTATASLYITQLGIGDVRDIVLKKLSKRHDHYCRLVLLRRVSVREDSGRNEPSAR